MLYTVVPLERVYADPKQFHQERYKNTEEGKDRSNADYKEVLLKNGRIVTRRSGDDYVVERINSTEMSDYLNDMYSPGKTYENETK